MPRVLLLIDEFQELFVEDDKVSQSASVLLDRIVRQGRAFGMHVILGSQTLGGAYTVARATLGQMVIRIALQCNEADAYLIMDDSNAAPRLLSRPGEGIYNDSAGAVAGNSPFQVVWMTDETRDEYLQKARVRADQSPGKYPGPFVYEGDAPANVQENALLADLLAQSTPTLSGIPRIWLGAPNSIKGPTELSLSRQSAKHVMIVGQREEAGLVMLSVALVALAAQHATGAAQFILFEGSAPGTPDREFIERLLHSVPNHSVTTLATSDLTEIMTQLSSELKSRSESGEAAKAPPIFVLIHELQRYKKLRNEDEFSFSSDDSGAESPAVVFGKLISEGSALGIHVLLTCDGYNNVGRFLNRKAVSEFETRVLFQMSANDSASLIDSPKASVLGMNRAVCYNDQVGSMEVFRPYATPDSQWFDHVREALLRRTR